MVDAFGDAANFVAMGLSEDLRITAIQHKAIIEVDKGGVVAAAASAVVGGTTSVPTPVSVNRPFIHLIRDRTTGAILFLGTITHLE
jgi:serpin B